MSTRIGERFARLRKESRKAFVAFLTAGDPSLERTMSAARELEKGGVDVLELGVPFSDPLADGPVIQRASQRALERGVTLKNVLEATRAIRASGAPASNDFISTSCLAEVSVRHSSSAAFTTSSSSL